MRDEAGYECGMRVDIITIFPGIVAGILNESIMARAQAGGYLDLHLHQLRDWTHDRHRTTDDLPYGGGQGMIMKPEPWFEAIEEMRAEGCRVILPSPQGVVFDDAMARSLAKESHLLFVCGHYEGIDQRVIDTLVDLELSIGDYVLTNGALAAGVIVDAVVRQIPGVLGDEKSAAEDSFSNGLLEGPHYTRPVEFRGQRVPEVLLSGNHAAIERWRREQAEARTRERRPDLWQKLGK